MLVSSLVPSKSQEEGLNIIVSAHQHSTLSNEGLLITDKLFNTSAQ